MCHKHRAVCMCFTLFLLFLFSPILSSQEVNIPWNAWSPRRGLRVSLTDIVMGMAVFAPETQFQSDSCWWTNHCTNQQHEKKCNILQGPVWSGNLCFNCVFCQTDVCWYQSEWCAVLVVCRIWKSLFPLHNGFWTSLLECFLHPCFFSHLYL